MTTPQRYERLRRLFAGTCDIEPKERASVLNDECAGDPSLRAEVEALLASDAAPDPFLESNALGGAAGPAGRAMPPDRDAALVGQRLSRYHIRRVIASGGMGAVYEAVQDKPQRTVAVKVMKRGIASRSSLRRFEYESQILARLRHPGIAQVYEAGMHETPTETVPYFAMEYVPNARTIVEYARDKLLGTRQRLELFIKVCAAVHHGHQKGIIHRDLKPGNILVDSTGEPKIIDFGVARATDSDLAITTFQTDFGQLIGTLQYMSPEQCDADPHDLDTRSDVYAMGVVLYELLCDQLPYDVSQVPVYEAPRTIREKIPAKPSAVNRALPVDLDWITMKALEKDRTRRYASAVELAADIQRHLDHVPVLVGRPSAAYRISKFVRRNKLGVAAAALLALAVLTGTAATAWQAVRATHAEARAVALAATESNLRQLAEKRREEADLQRIEAERQAAIAQAVNDFLNEDLLAAAAPEQKGRDVTVRAVLDVASETVKGKFEDEPLVEASIHATLGKTYRSLGLYDLAEPHLVEAVALLRAGLGEDDPTTLKGANELALLYKDQGRYEDAETLFVEIVEGVRRVLGEEHPDTLACINNQALVYWKQGRYDDAEPLLLKTLETQRRLLGAEHPSPLNSMNNLASLYWKQGRYDETVALYVETLEIQRRVLGDEHPDTLKSASSLARVYEDQGHYADAESLSATTLEIRKRVLGEEHPDTLTSMSNLALVYWSLGRRDKTESLYTQTLEIRRRTLGEDHPHTLSSMNSLAAMYRQLSRYDEAEPLYVRALESRRRVLGEDHPDTATCVNNLAVLYQHQGRYGEAETYAIQAIEMRRRVLGEEHPRTLTSMNNLASVYRDQGRFAEAEAQYAAAVAGARRTVPKGHWYTGVFLSGQGFCLTSLARYEEAEAGLREAHQILAASLGPQHEATIKTIKRLADLYDAWGKPREADQWRAKLGGQSDEPGP